ncbi:MAG: TetR/AcrR family transcriptional regulator [Polyangiaceae bacterium]
MARVPKPERPRPKRVRRTPEDARALLLETAVRLLAEHGPDGVGLTDVARAAGVSHALVTHYFGTIGALVDAALERHAEAQRAKLIELIQEKPDAGPREWMDAFFSWIRKPETARLVAWALMTNRVSKNDFFSRRVRGAKRVADAVEERMARDATPAPRADLEFAVLLLLSASHGYALGRAPFWASLGVDDAGPERDADFFDRLGRLAESMIVRPSPTRGKRADR